MPLDPSIILSGNQLNAIGALSAGQQAGQLQRQTGERNALQGFIQQRGADVLAGDNGAVNSLANYGIDGLNAAQGVQSNQRQMEVLNAEEARAIESHALKMSSAERAAEAARIEEGVRMGLMINSPEEWDAMAAQNAPELVGKFAQRDQLAAKFMATADVLKMVNPEDPKPADEYQRYVQEEQAAGRQPLSRIDFSQALKGEGVVMTMPDGTSLRVGGKSSDGRISPSSPAAMISTIDGILSDPALENSTGLYSPLQAIPGTPQKRFAGRARQLEGQAFLQAFESLKGAGQITEIEGAKATQAIGRLDTAQSAEDYRAALTELREVLAAAQARPAGWAEQQTQESDDLGIPPVPQGLTGVTPDNWPDIYNAMTPEDRALFQ